MSRYVITLTLAATFAALPSGALVRLGVAAAAGFAFPVAQFDNEVKTAPSFAGRVYVNGFDWLALELGADYHLKHGPESDAGVGETRLWDYRAGLLYKVDMGVFKPYLGGGAAMFKERIKRATGWASLEKPGFYLGPGIEYYFDEPFLAFGSFQYNRALDAGREQGRDTQFIKLDFGVAYFIF